jgi:hypothetical protein
VSVYREPIAPDLLGLLYRHTDCDGVVDDFAIARELAEERMHGRALRYVFGLTAAEETWTRVADWLVFLFGADDPAECLASLRDHAASMPCPYTARYLAEVGPRLEVAAERRAALRERRDIAAWARRDHADPLSF